MSSQCEAEDAAKETSPEPMDEVTSAHNGSQYKDPNPNSVQGGEYNVERAPSVLSIKSDRSMGLPGNFKGEFTPDINVPEGFSDERAPSVLSMKNDRSMGLPGNFKGDFTPNINVPEGFNNGPVPSVLSMKSDRSMGLPGNFKGDITPDTKINLDQFESSSIVSSAVTSSVSEQWLSSGVYHQAILPEGVQCDVCSKKAAKSCLTCSASFCEDHIKIHYTAPAMQRHKLIQATRDLEERLCQLHSRHLELLCQTDKTLICALCSVEEHKGHDITADRWEINNIQIVHMKEPEWEIRNELAPPGPIKFSSVKADSVTLSWSGPESHAGYQKFRVSMDGPREQRSLEVTDLELLVQGLTPHEKYDFKVASIHGEYIQSTWVTTSVCTVVPVPKGLAVTAIGETSIHVTWKQPDGTDHISYRVTLRRNHGLAVKESDTESREDVLTISTKALECSFSELLPATHYTIEVSSVLKSGHESELVAKSCHTEIPVPENLMIESYTTTTVNLSWSLSDKMDQVPHKFLVSFYPLGKSEPETKTISVDSCHEVITGLEGYTSYSISVFTIVENVGKSKEALTYAITDVLPVTDLTVSQHISTASINWTHQQRFWYHQAYTFVSCHSDESDLVSTTTQDGRTQFYDLKPNTEYTVTVIAMAVSFSDLSCHRPTIDGIKGNPVSISFVTSLPPPGPIQFTSVKTDSLSFTWGLPKGLTSCPKFKVSLCSISEENARNTPAEEYYRPIRSSWSRRRSCELVVPIISHRQHCNEKVYDYDCMIIGHGLRATFDRICAGKEYKVTVATLSEEGKKQSTDVFALTQTAIPAPVDLIVNVEALSVTWQNPSEAFGTSYQLRVIKDGECLDMIRTTSSTWTLTDLCFETEYSIELSTLLHGRQSKPLSKTFKLVTPTPQDIDIVSVSETSAELDWSMPSGMTQIPHSFLVSYHSRREDPQTITTQSCNAVITGLTPDTEYTVSVSTKLHKQGHTSQPATITMHTDPPPPGPLKVSSVSSDSVSLCWERPAGLAGSQRFKVSYTEILTATVSSIMVPGLKVCILDLLPGEGYEFAVSTVSDSGRESGTVTATTCTDVPVPEDLSVELRGNSVAVTWRRPPRLDEVSYLLTLGSEGQCDQAIWTKSLTYSFTNLPFGPEYSVMVCSVLANGRQSKHVSDVICQTKRPRLV
ncbi:fibronectin-like [Engraulis encrasicolus]|uniref:fibronectin-like n=1 Tax=Engraulis encrasicolus TaxID=184585 RepID=UPI002FD37805